MTSAAENKPTEISDSHAPRHIAIIMDGNGRWANARGLPRQEGHRHGVERIREITRVCAELGIHYLTLYAFSKENWSRPKDEVNFLMKLLSHFLDAEIKEMSKMNVRFRMIGRLNELPVDVQKKLRRNVDNTKNNTGITLTLALSYSARAEILDAVKAISQEVKASKLSLDEIDERLVSDFLYTKGMPDPDLLIRTSGELRVSNFLLWQISYAEIYITEKFWPDFGKDELIRALEAYKLRERRFGHSRDLVSKS